MTDDHSAFLRHIIAEPEDDLPRLIFADWLDEHGEAARAEFIRVQCELARPMDQGRVPLLQRHRDGATCGCRECTLRRRERELWPGVEVAGRWVAMGWPEHLSLVQFQPIPRRGFVEQVTCTAADWLRHRAEITAGTPLRRATLTDLRINPGLIQTANDTGGTIRIPIWYEEATFHREDGLLSVARPVINIINLVGFREKIYDTDFRQVEIVPGR